MNNLVQYSGGADVIDGFNMTDTLHIVDGSVTSAYYTENDDVIINVSGGADYPLSLTSGADNASFTDDEATVYALAGNDTLKISGSYGYYDGGAGNDVISVSGGAEGNTLVGGAGADSIITNGGGNVIVYNSGDGKDTIVGYGENDSLMINGTVTKAAQSGANVLITVGSSTNVLTIKNTTLENLGLGGGDSSVISGTNGADSLSNSKDNVTIDALTGNDTVSNTGENVSINGGGGNDRITNSGSSATGNTIAGGAGNDTIYTNGAGNLIRYDSGGGRDTIYGFGGEDSIQITSGEVIRSVQSGANVLVSVGSTANAMTIRNVPISNLKVSGGVISYADEIIPTLPSLEINNTEDYATIRAGSGNHTITNEGHYVYADGGADVIFGFGENDSVELDDEVTKILSVDGDVRVTVSGSVLTFKNLAAGNLSVEDGVITYTDEIIDEPDYPISLTNGADSESFSDDGATVYALTGNDTIENTGGDSYINGGASNDRLINSGDRVTLAGEAGNDTLISSGNDGLLYGGAGNDIISISSDSEYNTISGGAGNDTIFSNDNCNLILYSAGDGKDTIIGFGWNDYGGCIVGDSDSIKITNGTVSRSLQSGDNVIFYIGAGSSNAIMIRDVNINALTVENGTMIAAPGYSNPYWSFTANGDYEVLSYDGASVDALAGNDTVVNNGEYSYIYGNAGNDRLVNTADLVTISGGVGNDILISSGNDGMLDGGAGADFISLGADVTGNTIHGGAGHDTIYTNGKGNLIQYASGDGNDFIYGFGGDDSIEITSGSIRYSIQSGANVVFYIDGSSSNTITIRDVDNYDLSVKDNVITGVHWAPPPLTPYADNATFDYDNVSLYAIGGNDTVENSGNYVYISGGAGNDRLINSGEEVTLSGDAGNDTLVSSGNNGVLDGGAGKDLISLGSEVSGNTISAGAGNDTIYTNGAGNLIQYSGGKDVVVGFGESDSIEFTGSVSRILQSGLNVIIYVGSGTTNSITLKNISLNNLSLEDGVITFREGAVPINLTAKNDTYSNAEDEAAIDALAGNDVLSNSGSYVSISGGTGNDSIVNTGNLVTLDGGAGNDTIYSNGSGNVIRFGSGDGKDVVFGFSGEDSIQITAGTVSKSVQSGANVLVTVGSSSNVLTIRDAQISRLAIENNVISAFDLTKYLTERADTTLISDSNIQVKALGGNDKITLTGSEVTLSGGDGNDSIITGGGANLFLYNTGDGVDTILGFSKGDSISVSGANVSAPTYSNSAATFQIGSGKIILRNAVNEEFKIENGVITIADDNRIINGTYYADKLENTLTGARINALDGIDTINNSGSSVRIDGGKGNDKIYNSGDEVSLYGGAGADLISLSADSEYNTIIGGAGADTIYSNGSGNLISYAAGEGKDVIFGFGGADSVEVTGGVTRMIQSGANVLATIGGSASNVLTFKNTALADLIAEDNFICSSGRNSNGVRIDDICAENYSVTNIETDSDFENLAQISIAAYSSEK